MRTWVSVVALSVGLCVASAAQAQNQSAPMPEGLGGQAGSGFAGGQVLARSQVGALTQDGVDAFIEALEFTHAQLGQPMRFDPAVRVQIAQALAQSFAYLPVPAQMDLVNARTIWTQYEQAWPMLPLEEKRVFAYEVLTLAYGEQAAAQALGVPQGGGGGSGGGGSGSSASGGMNVDPYVPGSDCWAGAGCSSYEADGGGTYYMED